MKQYMEIKNENKDCLILFRMGDFYETFFDDAKTIARELEITLTKRGKTPSGAKIPLAGVPYHSIDTYLPRLVKKGYKVAIVEQLEDPKLAKGVVKRGLVRIVSPGTLMDTASTLKSNNFIMGLSISENRFGASFADISTGEFIVTELSDFDEVINEITKFSPKEILIPSSYEESGYAKRLSDNAIFMNPYSDVNFYFDNAEKTLQEHFKVSSLDSFGLMNKDLAVSSSGALLSYIIETQRTALSYINKVRLYSNKDHMNLDKTTIKNLELVKSIADDSVKGSLLGVLDKTVTSMGARKLKNHLLSPLIDIDKIQERLDSVEELAAHEFIRGDIKDCLKNISDVERLISRINYGNANPRDLVSLKESLKIIPNIVSSLEKTKTELLKKLRSIPLLENVVELIERSIKDEPPAVLFDGGFIRRGYNEDLDSLREMTSNAKVFIKDLEAEEREKTGIRSLKIRYNKIFGYFIEVTHKNISQVPENYVKKQTLVNCERFITQELKEKESLILGATEKMIALEQKLFSEIIAEIIMSTEEIQKIANIIAQLDVLQSLSESAVKNRYSKPVINSGYDINLIGSRHPVIEEIVDFVPNDILITEKNRTMIITGPNMAGKSVTMRQVCLTVLLAQMGSFVPAEFAEIGIVDRIFSRVGASDDVMRGQSTFMVEMSETAQILNNATNKSLIILDEIGRGTSTFDGVALAWSVAEHINLKIRAKTMFATHYHVLNELEKEMPGVKNYNLLVSEEAGNIVFLRKLAEGGTDKSYGVHVAKLAGIPEEVIRRSKEIQAKLQKEDEIAERIVVEKKVDVEKEKESEKSSIEKKSEEKNIIREKVEKFTKVKQQRLDELF
ncbi:MAG: DNA mismatch repair protein MutS [Nanoarchaeota archaeon]|nr:DNA mismatch repair protein MutS [Nanoarchaeota archaeon]